MSPETADLTGAIADGAERVKVAALGGGFGLSTLLRGLKDEPIDLSAIVTVSDDGGSSGRLRASLDIIPPGDIRNCIVALSDAEHVLTELFQYRFRDDLGDAIAGHSFGNLFLVALSEVMGGMDLAIRETSRILAVRGRILPSTMENVRLRATLEDGSVVTGESKIPEAGLPVRSVELDPDRPLAGPEAVEAICDADLVILGPGSLFTSIIPNLLVPGIGEALVESEATVVFVVNVATQHGETDGFSAKDHLDAINHHLGHERVDALVVNSDLVGSDLDLDWATEEVTLTDDLSYGRAVIHRANVVDSEWRYRHDSGRLAAAVLAAYNERN